MTSPDLQQIEKYGEIYTYFFSPYLQQINKFNLRKIRENTKREALRRVKTAPREVAPVLKVSPD